MYLDRVLYPVTALGPGKRAVIWTSGCDRHCPGCADPELWDRHPEQAISVERLTEILVSLSARGIDGITLTGGEPFDQAQELAALLDALPFAADVTAFSGYTLEQLQEDPVRMVLLERIDVLIDGPYIESQNDGIAPMRGSVNQRIHYLDPAVRPMYEAYLSKGRQIENFIYDYKTVSVGIHVPGRAVGRENDA